jgi:hypothetical protein
MHCIRHVKDKKDAEFYTETYLLSLRSKYSTQHSVVTQMLCSSLRIRAQLSFDSITDNF